MLSSPARPALTIAVVLLLAGAPASAQSGLETGLPPAAGPVEILPLDEVKPGMRAIAWTAFEGAGAEPVPVEILGVMRNAWGPRQDIILAKLGGRAERTNVAGGMSGSPVYYDGKLLGAVSLRFSTFSPDAIAGITPIELMLEIDEFDRSRPIGGAGPEPAAPEAPSGLPIADEAAALNANSLAWSIWNNRYARLPEPGARPLPIETPIAVSGMAPGALDVFAGHFRSQGFQMAQGAAGAARSLAVGNPLGALKPGEPIAAVLMSGDMTATALGTVSYNDGRKVLGFGHPMFNSGPIEAPIATADVILVLASQLAPFKIANATSIVGALRQDRHSGILGVLGETARMTPVNVKLRTFDSGAEIVREKELRYEIFQNEKWTPQLLIMALFNSMFGLNDFAEEATFRLDGRFNFAGNQQVEFRSMQTASNAPLPAPLLLAASVASKLHRVFTNTRETPGIEGIEISIDLLPERRLTTIDQVWLDRRHARPGDEVAGKVVLQPYRGAREEKDFRIRIPWSAPKGRLAVTVSDSSAYNMRRQMVGQRIRSMSLPETVSLLNQERSNDQVYIALRESSPTAEVNDRTMPSIPLTALNVMRPAVQGRLMLEPGSPLEEIAIPLDSVVSGSQTVIIEVR